MTSPFVIYTPRGVPMAFPEDTPLDDIETVALQLGDGTQVHREEGGSKIRLSIVSFGELVDNQLSTEAFRTRLADPAPLDQETINRVAEETGVYL